MAARGVRIDPSAQTHLDGAITGFLGEIGGLILADARLAVPKKTGRLAESLMAEVHNKVLRVGSRDCNYATDVEMGTMPHLIVPNSKKALHWPGAAHPVAYVNHPGTAPRPYLRPRLVPPEDAVSTPTLRASSELVAVAWLTGVLGDIVATTLPKPAADGSVSWAESGFATITVVGGDADMYVPMRRPVVAVDCWAVNPNSQKPPWNRAGQLAEAVQAGCYQVQDIPRLLILPGGYPPARVLSAFTAYEPRRVPDDPSSYARYTLGLTLHWTELPL